MCGGGGGGDGGARAAEEKAAAERRASIGRINAVFDAPWQRARRDRFGNNVYDLNKTKLDENHEQAARQRKFQLARQGGLAGSQDYYTAEQLSDNYLEGLLDTRRFAEGREADLRSRDESARSNLIAQANAGLDAGAASRLALDAVGSNFSAANTQNNYANLGDLAQNLALGYDAVNATRGRNNARKTFEDDPYSWLSPKSGTGGSTTSIG